MYNISFPSLNFYLSFSKIAFSFFGIDIYKYAVCIVSGIILAMILCKISKIKFNIEYDFLIENITIAIIIGIIGARLYYVLFKLKYYLNNVPEIFNLRDGGLAIFGGLIFGALFIIINCRIKKKNILDFFDYIVPYVAIAQCIGRIGNFFNIEAYGFETNSFLRMGIYESGTYIEVHPTFLYESIATFIIFFILKDKQKNRIFKGEILLFYCMLYSGVRFFIEGLRVDSLMLYNIRISKLISLIIFVVCVIILIYKKYLKEKCKKI